VEASTVKVSPFSVASTMKEEPTREKIKQLRCRYDRNTMGDVFMYVYKDANILAEYGISKTAPSS
jgi:hypothetical protein